MTLRGLSWLWEDALAPPLPSSCCHPVQQTQSSSCRHQPSTAAGTHSQWLIHWARSDWKRWWPGGPRHPCQLFQSWGSHPSQSNTCTWAETREVLQAFLLTPSGDSEYPGFLPAVAAPASCLSPQPGFRAVWRVCIFYHYQKSPRVLIQAEPMAQGVLSKLGLFGDKERGEGGRMGNRKCSLTR